MHTNTNFWFGKRVLVTGHTGFKGSWLCIWLSKMGANVCGYALAPDYMPNLYEEAKIETKIQSCIGDIRIYETISKVILEFKPEIILHLAAQPIVRRSYTNPIETYQTNLMGTVNILDSARKVGCVSTILNVTTDKVYENNEWVWQYRESDQLGGHDPYSSSKACSEIVTSSFRNSYFKDDGVGLASARSGNVIGGGDWSTDRIIPDIISAFNQKENLKIRNPGAVRPWQYILDTLNGYLTLAENLYENAEEYSQAWNFGPTSEEEKSVNWIGMRMAELWGVEKYQPLNEPQTLHEAQSLKLDSSKARSLLKWKPLFNINCTLENTVNWYKSWLEKDDAYEICDRQINEYYKKADSK